jgi:hypothetical protein
MRTPREQPLGAAQQVIAFCKYGETAQQALASIAAAINEHAHGDGGAVAVETISHTVTQLAEPIPPVPGIGDPGPGYFVVTALVTFRPLATTSSYD